MYSKKNICRLAAVIAQCSSKLQNMLGVHCALSVCGDNIDIDRHTVESETMLKVVPCIIYTLH